MYLPEWVDSDGLAQNLDIPMLSCVTAVLCKALVVCFDVWVRVCLIHMYLGVLLITQSENSSSG